VSGRLNVLRGRQVPRRALHDEHQREHADDQDADDEKDIGSPIWIKIIGDAVDP